MSQGGKESSVNDKGESLAKVMRTLFKDIQNNSKSYGSVCELDTQIVLANVKGSDKFIRKQTLET